MIKVLFIPESYHAPSKKHIPLEVIIWEELSWRKSSITNQIVSPLPRNFVFDALMLNVTVFGDKAFKEVIFLKDFIYLFERGSRSRGEGQRLTTE